MNGFIDKIGKNHDVYLNRVKTSFIMTYFICSINKQSGVAMLIITPIKLVTLYNRLRIFLFRRCDYSAVNALNRFLINVKFCF